VVVVPGVLIGGWAVRRIGRRLFEHLVAAATVVGGPQLLLGQRRDHQRGLPDVGRGGRCFRVRQGGAGRSGPA